MPRTTLKTDASSSSETSPNPSSPYFISSSDNPNFILVSSVFNGVGFNSWKRSMIISLTAKKKIGFVDGTIVAPSEIDPEYTFRFRANSMVIGWLLNSLHKNIADSVLFLQTTKEIWTELKSRYEQSDGVLLYQIQQLYSLSQGTEDFSSYYTKLSMFLCLCHCNQQIPRRTTFNSVVNGSQ